MTANAKTSLVVWEQRQLILVVADAEEDFFCVLIALLVQLATLCTDGILKKVLEYGCYVLMYVMTGWLFIKVIAELKDKNSNWKSVYLSFTLFLCTLLVLYSSDGLFYSIATVLCTLAVPLMMLSLKKELSLDDIR